MGNRARGVVAELRGRLANRPVADEVLRERVRARLGTVVGYASAIEVGVTDGVVTLRGPVLADEVDRLMRRVRGLPGVKEAINQLDIHDEPGGVPALQGRSRPPRGGEVRELLRERWSSPGIPLIGLVAGAAMMLWMARRAGHRARSYDPVGW